MPKTKKINNKQNTLTNNNHDNNNINCVKKESKEILIYKWSPQTQKGSILNFINFIKNKTTKSSQPARNKKKESKMV